MTLKYEKPCTAHKKTDIQKNHRQTEAKYKKCSMRQKRTLRFLYTSLQITRPAGHPRPARMSDSHSGRTLSRIEYADAERSEGGRIATRFPAELPANTYALRVASNRPYYQNPYAQELCFSEPEPPKSCSPDRLNAHLEPPCACFGCAAGCCMAGSALNSTFSPLDK